MSNSHVNVPKSDICCFYSIEFFSLSLPSLSQFQLGYHAVQWNCSFSSVISNAKPSQMQKAIQYDMRIKKIYTNTPLNVNRVMKKWMLESARMWMSKRDGGRRKKRSEVIRRAEPNFQWLFRKLILWCVCVCVGESFESEWVRVFCCHVIRLVDECNHILIEMEPTFQFNGFSVIQ